MLFPTNVLLGRLPALSMSLPSSIQLDPTRSATTCDETSPRMVETGDIRHQSFFPLDSAHLLSNPKEQSTGGTIQEVPNYPTVGSKATSVVRFFHEEAHRFSGLAGPEGGHRHASLAWAAIRREEFSVSRQTFEHCFSTESM